MLSAGDTFHLVGGGHPWFILTDPDDNGEAVCVNITDVDNIVDGTTILSPGFVDCVTKKSCVYYGEARVFDLAKIEDAIKKGQAEQHESCDVAKLQKLRNGLLASEFTKKGMKDRCREEWGG